MARKRSDDHCVPGGSGLRCLHCGTEQPLAFPIAINVYAGAAKGFTKDHRACKPSDAGAARFRYSTPEEWLESWDTGASSRTIFVVMTGRPVLGMAGSAAPRDPSDFGRCYRLLAVAPGWRERMPEVAARYPEWEGLVARWDELSRLYEEESGCTGAEQPARERSAPKLFALMHEITTRKPAPAGGA